MPRLLSLIFSAVMALSALPAAGFDFDVQDAQLYKGQVYAQTTNGAPSLSTNPPYVFQAIIVPLFASYVSNASVETPALVTDLMTLDNQTNFAFTAATASQSALDAAYGEGTYNLNYLGHDDGQVSIPISLGADNFPPVPEVSDLVAAQSVIFSNEFTVTFAAEADAGTNDYVQLVVVDTNDSVVFQTGPIYDSEGLSATNTAITIPAHTLAAGAPYIGMLEFVRFSTLDLDSYPILQAGFFTETTFPIQTLSTNKGGTITNTPPALLAPGSFTGGLLTFTITSGSGSFASSGTYQLFTSPLGNNYFILGPAGQGLSSGTYTYTVTGTNSATLALEDAKLGTDLSLQINFEASGIGGYTISSVTTGSQSGAFVATTGNATVTPANLYLPAVSNGVFQSYISGQRGASYAVQRSSDLSLWSTLTNFSLADLSTNLIDKTGNAGQFYRVRLNSVAFAPASVEGQTFSMTITGGAAPFVTNGIVQWEAAASGNGYQILGATGATNGTGTYLYTVTGPSTAVLTYTDSSTAKSYGGQVVFTSASTGYFYTANVGAAGYQSGNFNMASGPRLFFGNVKFALDEARGASGVFPANGTAFSLSVTDAAGYVWALSVPADALLTSATISMTPFAGIDTSQLALPVVSGVQLGPEGMQFCDGVTLTLTAPAAPGAHATLLMGAGDGTGLLMVATTNKGNSFSTTLYHFSSGSYSDPPDPQWENYVNQNLPQAQAAYDQAQSQVQALERPVVQPPEPPDYEFMCSGNPDGDAAVNAYVQSLFANETTAIQNLLSAARTLVLLTGDDSYSDNATSLAEQLISTSCFRKVNSLFSAWSGNPLKFDAVATAALSAARQDELLGGPGLPNIFDQLVNWLSGNVLNRYWDKLRSQHDYTMAQVLLQIEREIQLLGGAGDDSFIQKVANAYSFQATINLNLSGYTGTGGGQFTLTAQGTVNLTGDPNYVFPLSGTNNIDYTAGTFYNATGDEFSLQLPLSYPQRVFVTIDTCTNLNTTVYMNGAATDLQDTIIEETWNQPRGNPPEQDIYLNDGFEDAFGDTYHNESEMYDCDYAFPVTLQNLQAEAANVTFTGPDTYFPAVTTTFTITLQHTPK